MAAVLIGAAEPGALKCAAEVLRSGGVVAYPTETFYALGAAYDKDPALSRIVAMKSRPQEKALPLIVGEAGMLQLLSISVDPIAQEMIERHWPGPLTLVLKARPWLSPLVTINATVAVRMPGHEIARQLSVLTGVPLTSTSANPSGAAPACTAVEVMEYFGGALDMVLDGGSTPGGAASTVVDATGQEGRGLRLIRAGACRVELG